MPALPPVPNVVRTTLRCVFGSDTDTVNRFFQKYGGGGPPSSADLLAVATATAAAWNAQLAPALSPNITLVEVRCEDLSSSTGSVADFPTSHPGTGSSPSLSAGAAFIIKELIERRYRGGHPKQYLAGLPVAAAATAQLWDPTFAANLVTRYTAFRAACAAAYPTGNEPVTDVSVSYYSGFTNVVGPSGRSRPKPTLRGTPVVDQVTSFTANPVIASQRRRNEQP